MRKLSTLIVFLIAAGCSGRSTDLKQIKPEKTGELPIKLSCAEFDTADKKQKAIDTRFLPEGTRLSTKSKTDCEKENGILLSEK